MDALQADILAVLKAHAKPKEEIPQPVAEYFTEEKYEELAEGLMKIIREHSAQ